MDLKINGAAKKLQVDWRRILLLLLCLPPLYWCYLLYNSQMIIVFDADDYEKLGKLFFTGDWRLYFSSGPNREPFYPLLIAFCMRISTIMNISFQKVQAGLQLLILLSTYTGLFATLKALKVRSPISSAVLLYFGLSPGILNSALGLWSEVLTYPFVLLLVWVCTDAWHTICKEQGWRMLIRMSVGLSFLLLTLTLTKAIFEFVAVLIAFTFIGLGLAGLTARKKKMAFRSFLFASLICLFTLAPLNVYKWVNYQFNGNYSITNRGPRLMYGSTYRKVHTSSTIDFMASIAMVPGIGFCKSMFSEKTCLDKSFFSDDKYGYAETFALTPQGHGVYEKLIQKALRMALAHPAPYIFLTMLEALKMFFWESTRIGFVQYPEWLNALYVSNFINYSLRSVIALFSFAGVICMSIIIFRRRREVFDFDSFAWRRTCFFLFLLVIVWSFIALHAVIATVLTRYPLPIASLYLLAIAGSVEFFGERKCKRATN